MIRTSDFIMTIRYIANILNIILKEVGKLKHTAKYIA